MQSPIKKKIYKLEALDQGRLILLENLQFDEIHIVQKTYAQRIAKSLDR